MGSPALVHGQQIVQVPKKLFELVAYLLLSGANGVARRTQIAEFLWDSAAGSQGSVNLRQLLMRLRRRQQDIGLELLAADDRDVWVNAHAVRIDLRELQGLQAGLTAETIASLARIYRGDLLDGHESSSGGELDEWLMVQRTRLRDDVGRALIQGLERSDLDLSGEQVRTLADTLLLIDPYQEIAYRALMRLEALEGRMDNVRSTFEACRRKLKNELDVSPEPKTVQLYLHLQSDHGPPAIAMTDRCSDGSRVDDLDRDPVASPGEPSQGLRLGIPKISVLMPVSQNGDSLVDLACSLVEDVTIGLCRRRTLSVIAPYTAWNLSLSRNEVDAHRQFGIDYLVHTHVQGFRDESLLYVKIVDARSRRIIWAGEYQFGRMATSASYKSLSLKIVQALADQIELLEFADGGRVGALRSSTALHHRQ